MRADSAISDPGYQDALRWLYGLSPNIRTAAQIVADHPRKLARMRALLEALGHPDRMLASALIAGTKGKGSIAACTESILRAGGYRTGMVTSPHLTSWCERTRIDGDDIDPLTASRLLPVVRSAMARLADTHPELGQPTTFEAGFAFALLAFAERGVEIAVVEAGVGGLHDATNVLEPLAVALAPVSYDHTATLGPTLTAIATEKTGVFRRGRLALIAPQPPEASTVVERAGAAGGARLEHVGSEWRWQPDDEHLGCGSFTIDGPRGRFGALSMPLRGRHQRDNASVAVGLATELLHLLPQKAQTTQTATRETGAGTGSTGAACAGQRSDAAAEADSYGASGADAPMAAVDAAVRAGLAGVRWPGRLQVLRERPWLVVDGAHNGDSAVRLAEAVSECFPPGRRQIILGTSIGKDVARMLDALLPLASSVTLTRSHHERSVPLDDLNHALAERNVSASIVPDVQDAIKIALARCSPDDMVLVTGSLFVVGEALEAYGDDAEAGR